MIKNILETSANKNLFKFTEVTYREYFNPTHPAPYNSRVEKIVKVTFKSLLLVGAFFGDLVTIPFVLTARVSLCLIGRVTRSPTRPDTRPTPTPRPPAFTSYDNINSPDSAGPSSRTSSTQLQNTQNHSLVDPGIGAPTWAYSLMNGKPQYSLQNLPPLRFHANVNFQTTGDLLEVSGEFSLSSGTNFLYTGQIKNNEQEAAEIPSIRFECKSLNNLLTERTNLKDVIPFYQLNCSDSSPVNLAANLRADYNIHPDATSYRFIYPIQLHPEKEKVTQFITALNDDSRVPSFLKGLMLIGGYAYYNERDTLIQVKSFSTTPTATETLSTGKALDPGQIRLPQAIQKQFQLGVDMTSGIEVWGQTLNISSPHANKITAPFLQHLTHFAYIPQNKYEHSTETTRAAPFGGFLYRTTSGQLQFIPIGGDFVTETSRASETSANRDFPKERSLFSIFYQAGAQTPSLDEITDSFLEINLTRTDSRSRYIELQLANNRYSIKAYKNKQTIELSDKNESSTAEAILEAGGSITFSGNQELFQQLLNRIYPELMKKMIFTSSNEPDYLAVRTITESVSFAPIKHLELLTQNPIIQYPFNLHDLDINYFNLNQRQFISVDAGGPSRDYISRLFSGILANSDLFQENHATGLFSFKEFKSLNDSEKSHLKNIGTFFNLVIQGNGNFLTGEGLCQDFFKILFFCVQNQNRSITDTMIIDFAKKFDETSCLNNDSFPTDIDTQYRILTLVDKMLEPDNNVINQCSFWIPDTDDDNLRIQAIENNWDNIKAKLPMFVIKQWRENILPAYILIGNQLTNRFSITSPDDLRKKIQGELDRESIKSKLIYRGNHRTIMKKVNWIRDWIGNESTTDNEVRQFITAITGAPSVGTNIKFRVDEMITPSSNCFPKYHTCSRSIDIPHGLELDGSNGNHHTKDQFINSFKEGLTNALAGDGFTFA